MSSETLSNTSLFYFPIIASNTVDRSEIQHTNHQAAKLRKKQREMIDMLKMDSRYWWEYGDEKTRIT